MSFAIDLDARHDFEHIDVSGLSRIEVSVLWADVKDMCETEDEFMGPLSLYFSRAEVELLKRIGGQDNVRHYVDCLVAGFRLRAAARDAAKL